MRVMMDVYAELRVKGEARYFFVHMDSGLRVCVCVCLQTLSADGRSVSL